MIELGAIISVLMFVVVITVILYRIYRHPVNEVLNPLLYLLLFSSLYYLLGGWTVTHVMKLFGFNFVDETIAYSQFLSIYTVLVYLVFYILSFKSVESEIEFNVCKLSKLFMLSFIMFGAIVGFYLLIKHGSSLYALSQIEHRVSLQEKFVEVTSGFYLGPVLLISLTFSSILMLSSRYGWMCFILTLPICLVQMLVHSRTYLSTFLIALIISLIIKNKDKTWSYIKWVIFIVLSMLLFTYKADSNNYIHKFYSMTAEFAHTYLTIPMLISNDDFLSSGSLYYYSNEILKVFGLRVNIPYLSQSLQDISHTYISLGSNNISEALFYGGWLLALIQPIVIACFILFVYKAIRLNNKYAYIIIFLLCIYMRTAVRGAMYLSLWSLLYYMVFCCVMIYFFQVIGKRNDIQGL